MIYVKGSLSINGSGGTIQHIAFRNYDNSSITLSSSLNIKHSGSNGQSHTFEIAGTLNINGTNIDNRGHSYTIKMTRSTSIVNIYSGSVVTCPSSSGCWVIDVQGTLNFYGGTIGQGYGGILMSNGGIANIQSANTVINTTYKQSERSGANYTVNYI